MLTSEDVPLNIDDLCSTMAADSAPSHFSHHSAFLLAERTNRPSTAGRQERRSVGCVAMATAAGRQPARSPKCQWRRVDLQPGRSTHIVMVRDARKDLGLTPLHAFDTCLFNLPSSDSR